MGGALSLLMSTPAALPKEYPAWMFRLLALFRPFVPKWKAAPGAGWFDGQARMDHVAYPQNPVRSVGELKQLLAEMRAALPDVRAPTLLIHSRDDRYVLPENASRIYDALGASDKEMLWLTGSGHVVTRDAARDQVFEGVFAFIQRVESNQ
jgi:carboxylesterase